MRAPAAHHREEAALDPLEATVSPDEVQQLHRAAQAVLVDEALVEYAHRIVSETRRSPLVTLGVSPRGFQSWYRLAQAVALGQRRRYAVPDDFKETAVPALAHRLVLAGAGDGGARAREESERVVRDLLERTAVPS